MKRCSKCSKFKKLKQFRLRRDRPGHQRDCWCNTCMAAYKVGRRRWERYGITEADVAAIKRKQGGVCAICRKAPSTKINWCVDHDHESGKVRGMLCRNCNLGIGHLGDDALRCLMASRYLGKARH